VANGASTTTGEFPPAPGSATREAVSLSQPGGCAAVRAPGEHADAGLPVSRAAARSTTTVIVAVPPGGTVPAAGPVTVAVSRRAGVRTGAGGAVRGTEGPAVSAGAVDETDPAVSTSPVGGGAAESAGTRAGAPESMSPRLGAPESMSPRLGAPEWADAGMGAADSAAAPVGTVADALAGAAAGAIASTTTAARHAVTTARLLLTSRRLSRAAPPRPGFPSNPHRCAVVR
jgi:hypothetical protein